MNILLTGANGFIGSHLVRKLVNHRNKIFITLRPHSNTERLRSILPSLVQVELDEANLNLRKAFSKNKIDVVMHLATYYRKTDSPDDAESMANANIKFPEKLVLLSKEYKVPYFINTGTCFEYAQSNSPLHEESAIKPFNYYAETKRRFEEILIKEVNSHPLKAITLKLFFPYGDQDNEKLVKLLIENIIKKKEFHVTKGEQQLSYTHVDDIVNAYELALSYIKRMESPYEVFNIGGHKIQLKDIFDDLEMISKTKELIIRDKVYSTNEIMHMFTDSRKAKVRLRWEQTTSLKKGLHKTYRYYLSS